MTEKILRFRWLIIAVMVLVFVPKTVQAQTTVTLVKPSSGDGTEGNPYQISSKENLYWFANEVNNNSQTSICAVLTADITVNSNVLDADGNLNSGNTNFYEWTPIGASYPGYTGKFDGQGHTISGLYFKKDEIQSNAYIGLFGYSSGTVKNVGVEDSYFNATATVNKEGMPCQLNIGGVCGQNNKGTITNCYNTGKICGTESCAMVGGVCGYNYEGEITNCYNTGTVSGTGSNASVGGVCGFNYGNNKTEITNCYNSGKVSETGNANIGKICGYNGNTITNCYYLTDENDSPNGIGQSSDATEDKIEGKSLKEFGNGSVAWLLNENATDGSTTPEKTSPWLQNLSTDGGDKYPVLKANTANGVCPIVKDLGRGNYMNEKHTDGNETIATTSDEGYDNLYSYICDKCKGAKTEKKMIKKLNGEADIYSITVNWNGSEWKTKEDGEGNTVILNDDPSKNGYNAPVVFTVTRAIHTHKIATEWSTLCLPYQITISNYTNKCKFYDLSSVGTDNITLTELNGTCTHIEAGTPVFIKRDNNTVTQIKFDENNVKMIQTPTEQNVNGDQFVGTFNTVELTKEANQDHLFIKNDNMWSVKQTGKDKMIVRPFRAYIIPATSNGAPKRSIVIDGEATAISDALDTLNDTNAEYYDMSGRRINSLQKGVNIIKSGNKTRKVIIK